MDILLLAFNTALILCAVYASINGGKTGKAGSALFIIATALKAVACQMHPSWAGTYIGLFAVDIGCLLALILLALCSDRYWPIWALGFQTVAVTAHIATLSIPHILPKSFQAIVAFWAIPIFWVMVIGTHKDQQFERSKSQHG